MLAYTHYRLYKAMEILIFRVNDLSYYDVLVFNTGVLTPGDLTLLEQYLMITLLLIVALVIIILMMEILCLYLAHTIKICLYTNSNL